MENSAYIISKPLQFFNASNIEDKNCKVLFIIDAFNDAKSFFNNVKNNSKNWNSIYFFNSYSEAFNFIKINKFSKLFIDGDYSSSMINELKSLKNINIFVYEEGLGSYTNNIRNLVQKNKFGEGTFLQKIKWNLATLYLKMQGHGNFHGGFKGTQGIYVYNQELHKKNKPNFKKEVLNFKMPFLDHLKKFEDRNIISSNYHELLNLVKGKQVLLYLTSWDIDPKIEDILSEYQDYFKILKPHPHINEDKLKFLENKFDYQIKGGNMVEFLISDLIEVVDNLVILHKNSAALLHIKSANIIEIQL